MEEEYKIRATLTTGDLENIYTQYLLSNKFDPNDDLLEACLIHHFKTDKFINIFKSKRAKITKKGTPYKQKKDGSFRNNGYVELINIEYYGTGR